MKAQNQNISHFVVSWCCQQRLSMEGRGGGGGEQGDRREGRGMARGHQLCLPADPNTLGFFATEGLKVHPTRSPTATQTNRNKTTENNKEEAKQLRVSWGTRSKRGLSALEFWGREGMRLGQAPSCLLDAQREEGLPGAPAAGSWSPWPSHGRGQHHQNHLVSPP